MVTADDSQTVLLLDFGILKDILSKPSIQSSSRVDATVPQRIPGNWNVQSIKSVSESPGKTRIDKLFVSVRLQEIEWLWRASYWLVD